jgi:hypothetical protein
MKIIMPIVILIALISCGGSTIKNNTSIQTGWTDEDTYTVTVIEENQGKAVNRARHQILKDIVDVRVHNNSRYTDIENIREEFTIPISNGIIISEQKIPAGVKIYFQIRDKGLKKKFQRQ